MVVLDVETTGTNPNLHSIVSIGAVDLDFPSIQFYVECQVWPGAHIEPEALAVNGFDETAIQSPNKPGEGEAVKAFLDWLSGRPKQMLAGQNPLFDIGFVQAAANRHHLNFILAHRSVDLHSLAFFHMMRSGVLFPEKNGKSDLNSDKIMEYVGLPAEPKPHKALNGAIWEAEALSRLLFGRGFLPEFSKFPIPWLAKSPK